MTETRRESETDLWQGEISTSLRAKVYNRAAALGYCVEKYLRHIYDRDSVLQIDQGIAVIVMAWVPLWLLMIALSFSPQGKDLLVHLGSDSSAALVFVAMLLVMCAVAAFGATALISTWLYPRLAFDRPHHYWRRWPEIPKTIALNDVETEDVIVSARGPILAAIGLPIALLVTASFTDLE